MTNQQVIRYCREAIRFVRKHKPTPEEFKSFRNSLANHIITSRYNSEYLPLSKRAGLIVASDGPCQGMSIFWDCQPDTIRFIKTPMIRISDNDMPMEIPIETFIYHRRVYRWIRAWRITETVTYSIHPRP